MRPLKDGVIAYKSDLAALQERIRRLHIRSDKDLPESLPIPGVIHSTVDRNNATVTVDGLPDDYVAKLRNDLSADISIEQLNLEDIFLEVNR